MDAALNHIDQRPGERRIQMKQRQRHADRDHEAGGFLAQGMAKTTLAVVFLQRFGIDDRRLDVPNIRAAIFKRSSTRCWGER